MKSILFAIAVFIGVASKAQINFEKVGSIKNVKMTVRVLGEDMVVIIQDGNDDKRYVGGHLPKELQTDGLKILVSGDVGKIPPNVRMIGVPFKPTTIRVSKEMQRQFKLTKRKWCL